MSIVIIVPGLSKSGILGSAVVQVPSLSTLMFTSVAPDMLTPAVNGVEIADMGFIRETDSIRSISNCYFLNNSYKKQNIKYLIIICHLFLPARVLFVLKVVTVVPDSLAAINYLTAHKQSFESSHLHLTWAISSNACLTQILLACFSACSNSMSTSFASCF